MGGQKRVFFGGRKSPILARGHMGKTAVFNQIVLYLKTPLLVEYASPPPSGTHPNLQKQKGPPRPFGPIELTVQARGRCKRG